VPEGGAPVQLVGYGLVVGLDRTGDRARGRRGAPYTVQSIANMLRQFGIAVDPAMLGSRNAAAVMVTATASPVAGPGRPLDVTVSALGDARSLSGGVLLQTPLKDPLRSAVLAMAQGPVSTGTVLASAAGTSARTGPTNTGRVPGGGLVTAAAPAAFAGPTLGLVLKQPDFTNATAIAEAVRGVAPGDVTVEHAGLVRVAVPADVPGGAAGLMAQLEGLRVEVDVPARVVINERTGTIVAGGDVRISEVMVTYGSLTISTQVDPVISQPNALGDGQTVAAAAGSVGIDQERARSVVLPATVDVGGLAASLNELGLTAQDVIAVFQAIDRAGALQGELVIL
ncbi:MAG: flagellar basal body P-ring protein FlgI, partial [Rhodothermales bacterium]|nr:flagellar basal body P-ring protein FlgI [Rhodothermales bacterium]